MNSMMEKIYFGDLRCEEKMMKDERVKESNQQFATVYESFDDVLNEKQKKKLSELYDEICNMETEIGLYFFKDGFAVGIRLGMEVYAQERE